MEHYYLFISEIPIYLFAIDIPYGEYSDIDNAVSCEIRYNSL